MPAPGPASRRLWIDWQFLPNAALGEAMGRAHGCYGATMALRAETLARLGGFAAPCPPCWRTTMRWGSRCGGSGCGWWWRRSCRRM